MTREAAARSRLLRALRATRADAVPIENAAGVGTPDLNYCRDGLEGWVEVKTARTPGDGSWSRRWTPQQRAWAARRRDSGGRVSLVIWFWETRCWGFALGSEGGYPSTMTVDIVSTDEEAARRILGR